MSKNLSLEIITPEKIAFVDGAVKSVNVPSVDGYLGILPSHAPLFAQLTEGELKIEKEKDQFFLAIGGGFIQVNNDKVIILVTRALKESELSEKEAIAAQERAKELLKEKPKGQALYEAQTLYRRALVDLKLLKRRRRKIETFPS